MSSPTIPTVGQLSVSRLAQWHQNGEALLTFENLRSWINVVGLVLFAPRPSQLPVPAPSFVEAVLGAPMSTPTSLLASGTTMAETEQARSLLARLVTEGIAVPLNLLGTAGETPDFIVSAPVFSYIFTLRGDKAWKQPPATSGAVKVSPLAAATHEALTKYPALSAYDLATKLGKEVTESAVLRALDELWAHLRVIPVGQPDGAATLWELTSARFTKHIKAGANAGQPSALSALISLYLGSALLASEEEVETFLSPLAARSRIRDVIHALLGARELETLVVEGRTLLHVSGSLPAFAVAEAEVADVHAKPVEMVEVDAGAKLVDTDTPRIKKFVAKPRKLGTGFPSDYGRTFSGAALDPRDRPARTARPDSERRPFARGAKPTFNRPASNKPAFNKPWDEEKAARPAAAREDAQSASDASQRPFRPARSVPSKPRSDRGSSRPSFSGKPAFGRKPAFGDHPKPGARPAFGTRPAFRGDDSGPPRRDVKPRADSESSGDSRPPRKTFSKPGTFGRKREGFAGRSNFDDSRPPRPQGGAGYGGKPATGGKPSYSRDRADSGGSSDRSARPTYRKFDAPRERAGNGRPSRSYNSDRSSDRGNDRAEGRSDRPARRPSLDGDRKPYGKSSGGGAGPRKPGSFSAKPSGTFAKFADGKNPFRKPGKPGGKAGSFKGKAANFDKPGGFDKPAYRKRKGLE